MSKLNRFRWVSWSIGLLFLLIFLIAGRMKLPVLEALSIIVLFVDFFMIAVKTRCPDCKRSLRLLPPMTEEEYCPYCGSKIE